MLTLRVFLAEFVEDVGGVKASVVAQLTWDDLQGLGVGRDQQLLLACDGVRVLTQEVAHLHLDSSTTLNSQATSRPPFRRRLK